MSKLEMDRVGSRWDVARGVLETRLSGAVTQTDVKTWREGLAHEVSRIPDGSRFKLLLDLSGFEPVSIEVHKAMREVVPRLLASHGLRPAFIDLFDEKPELEVTTLRGVECIAFANVHHDADKMRNYEARIGRANQRFFTERALAEAWLERLP